MRLHEAYVKIYVTFSMFQSYLIQFVNIFTQILIFAIFARVILSWLRVPTRGFLVVLLIETTEPILGFFRRLIPPIGGVLDLSPLFAFLALDIVRSILIRILA